MIEKLFWMMKKAAGVGAAVAVFVLMGCASSTMNQAKPATTGTAQPQLEKHVTDVEADGKLPELDEDAPLQDYLRYAALNNAGLEAAFKRWKAALEKIAQVETLPDPSFNYTYFIENVETRVGPQEQKFGLMQTFPWFGKLRLRGDAASQAAAAARQEYEKIKLDLFERVKSAYHEYWYLGEAIAVTEQHIELVANLEGVARSRYKAGAAPNSAMIQAQVEQGKLADRLKTLKSMREPTVAKLNAAMNRDNEAPLPWPKELPEAETAFSDEQAVQSLAENNPDLRRLGHLIEKEETDIELARKEYYPNITLAVDYVATGEANNTTLPDSGKDPVMGMVSINLPIWHGKYRAAEKEASLKKVAAEKKLKDTGNNLEAQLELALFHLRDAERKIDLYGDTLVPKAKQSLNVTRQGFEAGETGFIAMIDAERLLLEFQLAHRRAQADRGQRLAEVEALMGGR